MAPLPHGLTRMDMFNKSQCEPEKHLSDVLPQQFGRMFHSQGNDLVWNGGYDKLVHIFLDLVGNIKQTQRREGPADAGMTFFGQFIDHDITLDVTSAIGTKIDPRKIRNVRTPNLDLDCVYGDGPEASPHLYAEMEFDDGKKHGEFLVYGNDQNDRDLARTSQGTALIGDFRNDENAFVAQVQGAFITLHNILMAEHHRGGEMSETIHDCAQMGIDDEDWDEVVIPRLASFEEVRRFIRLHYQYLILKDFLPQFITDTAIAAAMKGAVPIGSPTMPVEFSVAAFRYGHATVQPSYQVKDGADPIDLFTANGFGHKGDDVTFDSYALFFGKSAQRAQPVGLGIAPPLYELPFVASDIEFTEFDQVVVTHPARANLALRNVLRDRFALSLASGQEMAAKFKCQPLPVPKELSKHHISKTPLWYYCLEEAEAAKEGKLTGVGGRIVAGVLINLMKRDKSSVIHVLDNFVPYEGFGGKDMTMGSLMQWIDDNRDTLPNPQDLHNG